MGVPQFYRWLSERYPCLCETISSEQVPEFDNLYLDMNGIIHPCSHPDDDVVCSERPESEVFDDIAKYIQLLFQIINPKKVLFLAVDGVAPRAKMSQQRSRRFVSSKNSADSIARAEKNGSTIDRSKLFDSNCITPGTEFMARLHDFLTTFVKHKVETDEAWKSIKVYLSGHDCFGEGEHKIMDFIRYAKSRPGYDPNTRHCMYGLDADLIILGTCSHEPHFTLLREEISFTRRRKNQKKKRFDPNDNKFLLLHVSLLREYIDMEFACLKDALGSIYDLESMIDDWVLMTFLVGNDFIPHLPQLHIRSEALPSIFKAYKSSFLQMKGNLFRSSGSIIFIY
ncbi:unnamed protein product [Soboliphyme baturini]|uniref:5'-3' exoribonuclease 1 n=1 Tax=Soboliphyme baturini TaxID=241478 RepID=A0A183IJ16_9BILA|nr:unnamed protein product [Soboliphyme baturini]